MIVSLLALALFAQSLCASDDAGADKRRNGAFNVTQQLLTGNFEPAALDRQIAELTPEELASIDVDALQKDIHTMANVAMRNTNAETAILNAQQIISGIAGFTLVYSGLVTGLFLSEFNVVEEHHAISIAIPQILLGAGGVAYSLFSPVIARRQAYNLNDKVSEILLKLSQLRCKQMDARIKKDS